MKIPLLCVMLVACAVPVPAAVSQFDFEGNLDATTGPATMSLFNGTPFGNFATDTIAGETAGVYQFRPATASEGLRVDHNAPANGGGAYVNQYSLGFDIKWTGGNPWAAFYQTNVDNSNDGDLFRDPAGGIGISGVYSGNMVSDTWYRAMFVLDQADLDGDGQTLYKYLDGTLVGAQNVGGLDSRWTLDPYFYLLTDNDGDTSAGSISSFYFEDRALSAAEVAAFGGPRAGGFVTANPIPEPSSMALLGLGVAAVLGRRRKKN